MRGIAVTIPFEHERLRLVLPFDGVEVEELGELPFRVVRKAHLLVRELLGDGSAPLGDPARRGLAARCARCSTGVGSQLVDPRIELFDDVAERDDVEHALAVAHQIDAWPRLGTQEQRIEWFEESYAQAAGAD